MTLSASMPNPTDPFAPVRAATNRHRASHGCSTYPFDDGRLLGVVAAATQARRILEFGTALGYSALWLASGAPDASIDKIDRDPEHVRLAREHIAAHGMSGRINVHEGEFGAIIAR